MKTSHRIFRDVSIVIAFCVGFLGLIGLANFLQNDSAEQTSSEFSEYRIGADTAAAGQDLDVSLKNLRALVKNDPYDGRAQYELASVLFSRLVQVQDSITESEKAALPNSTDSPNEEELLAQSETELVDQSDQLRPLVPSTQSSTSSTDVQAASSSDTDTDKQVRVLIDQAIQEYQQAEKHARYRLRSQVQLAVLLATKGDDEAAMDNLDKFVNAGGATRRGLDQIQQFGSGLDRSGPTGLHAQQRFLDIIDRERENRIGRGYRGGLERRSQRTSVDKILSLLAPSASQPNTSLWDFLDRLNNDLIFYRIKLVNFIRELFK